jgi:hypothetical protein
MSTEDEASYAGEIDEDNAVDQMLLYALEQAAEMLEQGEGFDPFTILLKDDEFFIEEHPGDAIEDCSASAQRTIRQMALVTSDYVFCYDGYVDLDEGQHDAIIAERGHKGSETAEVFAMLYEQHDDHLHFDDTLYGIGEADNHFAAGDVAEAAEGDVAAGGAGEASALEADVADAGADDAAGAATSESSSERSEL